MHEGVLHMQAIYRNEYLVERGYGNFLGLAELQTFIAAASGLAVGELMVTIGNAQLDGAKTRTNRVLGKLWEQVERLE